MTIIGFFTRLYLLALFPAAFLYIFLLSEISRLRNLGRRDALRFEVPYDGRKILLLALYQKGVLRPDTLRLLQSAQANGLYVIAVNTLGLRDLTTLRGLVDCYIERPNFGRDFGSYKTGFAHIYGRGWHSTCPRLMMLNDSVFFTKSRMPAFLGAMMDSDTEVLGSTENFDIDYHLGSFCIALGGNIVAHRRLRAYWRKYRLTDVRPTVIARGELGLSRVLKRIVTSPGQFRALYSADLYLKLLGNDDELLDFAVTHARGSTIFGWKRASLKGVAESFRARYLLRRVDLDTDEISIDASKLDLLEESYLNSFADVVRHFRRVLPDAETFDPTVLRDIAVSDFAESFMSGSQIHQNAAIMLRLGLPIVKLDALYRGICDIHDIRKILSLLPPDEAAELQGHLVSRPYGGRYLTGLKRAAFERGLI